MRLLPLFLALSLLHVVYPIYTDYCGSNCLDYLGTCFTQTYSDTACIVCATSIYHQDPDPTTGGCILNNQTTILSLDLQAPISYDGFSSSSLVPFTCGSWVLSGKYVEGGFLSKTYNTPINHYMVVLRYNLIFMGNSWSTADTMTVAVDSNVTSFNYKCANPTVICTSRDCPKIGEIKATHNASTAVVTFTSNILNTSGSSWGISNLIVVLLTCNASCNTCFGPAAHQCLSCSNTSFLLGNTCVKQCPVMSVPSLNLCTPACPGGFYPVTTTSTCSPCSKGCSVCTGPLQKNCILDVNEPSLWEQQKQFWIFLIVLGCLIVAVALIFLVLKRRREKIGNSLKERIIQPAKPQNQYPTEVDMENIDNNQKSQAFINDRIEVDPSQSSSSNSNESDDGPKPVKVKRKWKGKE